MAGTATHLAVADLICEKLGNDKFNLPLFYSGNIAPDAIHSRVGYQRVFKKHTHLTEGMSGADFQIPEKVEIFHERLIGFINERMAQKDESYDLYLGYVCHLTVDEYFNIDLRKRIVDASAKEGVPSEGSELARVILHDMDCVDRTVITKYPFFNDVRSILSQSWNLEIEDMVNKEETNKSKRWVIDKLFFGDADESEPKYFSYSDAVEFISSSADSIIRRFTDGKDFPVLF